jgi:hypothetical protein
MAERLPSILKGDDAPKNPGDAVNFASMAYNMGHYAGSARLFASAFEADSRLADDLAAGRRYNAACAAALAAAGQGDDAPAANDPARARLRAQALDWLKADLASCRRRPAADAPVVARVFHHWQVDPDLAGVRDPEALARLPEDERRAWRVLWDDVAAALRAIEAAPKGEVAAPRP